MIQQMLDQLNPIQIRLQIIQSHLEMETGTYLTQIAVNNQNHQTSYQKFTRFNLTESKSHITLTSPLHKIRHSNRKLNKGINTFLPEEYYATKKAKPGLTFYRTILQAEQKRKTQPNIPYLNLQISPTLILVQNSLQLIYSQGSVVIVKSQVNFNDFLKIVKPLNTSSPYASVLTGIGNGIYTDFSVSLSNQLDTRILPRNQNQVSIRFVQPYGQYPNSLRLFYVPKSVKGAKPNYAYKTINKRKINEELLEKKYKQIHNFVVDVSKSDYIITTLVKGKALSQVQCMAQSMVQYIQSSKKCRISEIVVDFIFGEDRVYYFHQIKNIKSSSLNSVWDIGTVDQMNEKYKEQTNQIMCKLCSFYFSRTQMTKIITNKLILELLNHLKSRGQQTFCNTLSKGVNLSASSNVCDLCYELIVAEHQLIDIQHQFYSLTSVKSDPIMRVQQIKSNRNALALFNVRQSSDMTQWRLFFYIQRIKNTPLQNLYDEQKFTLNMKFNDFKQTFTRTYRRADLYSNSRVNSALSRSTKNQYKRINSAVSRHEKKSTLHTNYTNRSYDNFWKQNIIDFQKIKLITFFTKQTQISTEILSQQLFFEISYKNHLYKGESSTLQNFTNKKQCQRHSCQVLLFDTKYQYCNLQLNVGLICDGLTNTSQLSLTQSESGNLFYSNSLQSCQPLPAQWVQIISEGLVLNRYEQQQFPTEPTIYKYQTLKRQQSDYYLYGVKSRINRKCGANITQSKQQQQQQQYL